MNASIKFGVALIALALMIVPALAVSQNDVPSRELQILSQESAAPSQEGGWRLGLILSLMVLAGTTVTYLYPVASTTTAPTAIQSSQTPTVVGQIAWADADTVALFTHNLGIATAPGFAGKLPAISQGFPEVIMSYIGISTVVGTVSYTNTSGNVITFAKASLLGTAGTLLVTVRSPQTLAL